MRVRLLGAAGVVGGIVLLGALIVEIPADVNTLRIVVVYAGAIAIAAAILARLRGGGSLSRGEIAGPVTAIAADLGAIAWIVLSIGRDQPGAGDFGLAGFAVAFVAWVANGAVGLIAARTHAASPIGGTTLAFGTALAITGMDRLGLMSGSHPTIFGTISLVGIVLVGIGWIVIGLDLARPWSGRLGRWSVDDAAKTDALLGD